MFLQESTMKCFVTGATGFVGADLVQELLARGHRVKALVRAGADDRALLGLKCERVTGDILDRALLERELRGSEWCFHTAADCRLWTRHPAAMRHVNIEGTRNVLAAAGNASCARIIFTSTALCIGLPNPDAKKIIPATEIDTHPPGEELGHYVQSKFQAEAVAMELFRKRGLPVVIVNPTTPVGPGDHKPTPTGRLILDFLNRRLPAYLDTGMNWVHVRDVAIGHILAAEKGALGQRYILGNSEGNWTLSQTFAELSVLTRVPAPTKKIPRWLALSLAEANEIFSAVTGREPRVPVAGVQLSRYKLWFNPAKAIRELGLPQTPPPQAFADAATWFRANGYWKK
jgi:dihydroflavonol-4-reductase